MGNKIVIVKPPVQEPPSFWKFPSFNTVFNLLTVGCVGYVIVQLFFSECIRCHRKNISLDCLRRTVKANGRLILKEKRRRCAKEIERLLKAKDYFPENSTEGVKLLAELTTWRTYESELNTFYRNLEIQDCNYPYNGFPSIPEPRKSFLDKTTINYLLQSSLEIVFWENTTAKQRDLLSSLVLKLKKDFPQVTEEKLRSTIAHVCNKEKRGVFSSQMNRIERSVKKALANNNAVQFDDEDEEICTICLSEIVDNIALTECLHSFHKECISVWFNFDNTCPVCRTVTRISVHASKPVLRPINRR